MIGQAFWILLSGRCGRPLLAACALLALIGAMPARAQFSVCNQTLDALNVAIAYSRPDQNDAIVSEGWWTIGANRCVDVIKEELATQYIYVYASDVFGQPIMSGDVAGYDMCVSPKVFTGKEAIVGTDSCWQRGFQKVRFMEVDTKEQSRWTLFLKQPDSG